MSKRAPFPLQWPDSQPRSRFREQSSFAGKFARDRDDIIRWLGQRGSNVVITSNLPTNTSGLPIAAVSSEEPGIAVYWIENGNERVIACDRWNRAPDNLRAIAKTVDALRGIDRWGAKEMVERAFAGFTALPPGAEPSTPPPSSPKRWWETLGVSASLRLSLTGKDLLAVVKQRHRELIKAHHPDRSGDAAKAAEINAALADAEKELA